MRIFAINFAFLPIYSVKINDHFFDFESFYGVYKSVILNSHFFCKLMLSCVILAFRCVTKSDNLERKKKWAFLKFYR